MTIQIKDIKTTKNVRTNLTNLSELMSSIKQHGILQPIGLWQVGKEYIVAYGNRRFGAVKKLGWKELPEGSYKILSDKMDSKNFLVLNAIENIHREDITPLELGKLVKELREQNLNFSEISVLLSINPSRIKNAYQLYGRIPEKFQELVGYRNQAKGKSGRILATTANRLVRHNTSDKTINTILDYAHSNEISGMEVESLVGIMERGVPFEKAKEQLETLKVVTVHFVCNKDQLEKAKQKYNVATTGKLMNTIVKKMEPDLVQ